MILEHLQRRAAQSGQIRTPGQRLSWCEFHRYVLSWTECFAALAGRRVAAAVESPLAGVGVLMTLESLHCEIAILPIGRAETGWNWQTLFPAEFLVRMDERLDPGIEQYEPRPPGDQVASNTITVFSSGTTGTPHPHRWPWIQLWQRVRVPDRLAGGLWLSAYAIDTFAGLQSAIFGCAGAETLGFVPPSGQLDSIVENGEEVRLLMATPTFCRRALLGNESQECLPRIRNLTLGGEPVSQELLDKLHERLPECRVVHVYASTEFGSLFSVSDGLAGFPASWLGQRRAGGIALDVKEGELYVSPAEGQRFLPTGDCVRIDRDRVCIDGRLKDTINVGGYKVSASMVESLVRTVAGVRDVRARPIPSPLTGQLVAVDVVLTAGSQPAAVEAEIHRLFREHASSAARPRKVVFLSELPVTPAGKMSRR